MFVISNQITSKKLRDHPFSQRNRTTERTVGVGVGGDREVGWGDGQNLKKRGGG